MLSKFLKITIFFTMVAVLYLGFSQLFRTTQAVNLSQADTHDEKSRFLEAVQTYDLAQARAAYDHLVDVLQEEDPFLTEIAPAYLADLYIQYAQQLGFNDNARETMLGQARQLAPDHPALLKLTVQEEVWEHELTEMTKQVQAIESAMQAELDEMIEAQEIPHNAARLRDDNDAVVLPDDSDTVALSDGSDVLALPDDSDVLALPDDSDAPLPEPVLALVEPPVEETPDKGAIDKAREYLAMQRQAEQLKADQIAAEALAKLKPEPEPELKNLVQWHENIPMAPRDRCMASFYDKRTAVSLCADPISPQHTAPALVVVGDGNDEPALAFTQQPISYEDYELYCNLSNACLEDAATQDKPKGPIDLSDVENTLHEYNAYCLRTGGCEPIPSKNTQTEQVKPLSTQDMQRYAQWLSTQTGYHYRVLAKEDLVSIYKYFYECVQMGLCDKELLHKVHNALKDKDRILVRELTG